MSWWGKAIGSGLGFMMGGPLGAIIGATFGHRIDQGLGGERIGIGDTERTQVAFFTATFSIMGYLAKADGKVSASEISMAEQVMTNMRLMPEQRKAAISLFNQGKQDDFPIADILLQFRRECHRRSNLLQMFLEILISTALADGVLHADEKKALYYVAQQLGFNAVHIDQLIKMVGAQQHYADSAQQTSASIDDAYAVLGIESSVTDGEMKTAYRRLMAQHHPDKLVSKGLPEEMIRLATEKTQEINAAYRQIKKSRKSQ
ncbi:DnaJ-like protein DjlA [uncultured Gammaproteobacteria bacterium]|uniref:co-chaperone DjlA n=1 Tax=Bathymodiolus heckerae thiotrophic gill symbiont TaxID=1052212 RepID=UPI0010BB0D8C|nr:co-chaperone DjlA [Bathymodiolus heckerae thiotrophic gill symbiont]CAC9528772.1 DnaJ-like protein DjlA [uncultured Gammaproteobacteria bacterium]CAC9589139.1 DnaJ-like protein DjlA [uncultured Gammaproteobacteria bacterium]CAC9593509.1 DnaJ-like protein DjlA [uncultured Gammaproteobacteria bacterium]SHN92303.1 DnaJ-like protein DjlA [Bathymodiolus heckerae thiotrophic gill symbiont]